MKKFMNMRIGGIQQKMFNLVLSSMVLVVIAYTAVILWQSSQLRELVASTNERQQESIDTTVRESMDENLSAAISEATQMKAYIADDMFRDVTNSVTLLAEYSERLFANPEGYSGREVKLPDASTDGQTTVQLLTNKDVNLSDPAVARRLNLVGGMSDLLCAMFDNSEIDSCYVALPSGVMVLADDHASSKFDANGTLVPIDITNRPWYVGAVEKGSLYFTDVAEDVFSGKVGIMCAMPVYRNDTLVAVVGADLLLDNMAEYVTGSTNEGEFTCIVNDLGHVIFSPREDGVFRVRESGEVADIRQTRGALSTFVDDALKGLTGPTYAEVDGVMHYLCGAPIETVGWTVISAQDLRVTDAVTEQLNDEFDGIVTGAQGEYYTGLSHSLSTIIVLLVVVMVVASTGALVFARRIVGPLGLITDRVRSLGGDNLKFMMEDEYKTGDEIEVLAESFAHLSYKTLQYVDEVTRVTAEKERMGVELDMARAIQESQLPRLFPPFPGRHEFDIFASMDPAKEVGGDFYDLFLVDDDHIGLVIADVSGKGIPASLFMMVSRVLIKSCMQSGDSPAKALTNVNERLCENNDANLFVTVWAAVIQISTGHGVAANAGHEHPVLRRVGGSYDLVVYRHAPAVGVMDGIPFGEHDFVMRPGDSLFVYTDGVPEATNAADEMFGADRMLEALNIDPDASPREVLANVRKGVDAFVLDAEQFDDLTMLCFRYVGPQET